MNAAILEAPGGPTTLPVPGAAVLPAGDSAPPPRSPRHLLARALGLFGRVSVTAGALVLLFACFQLWGTDVIAAGEQRRLEGELQQRLGDPSEQAARRMGFEIAAAKGDGTRRTARAAAVLRPGEPVARIRIPAIGVRQVVVQGVTVEDLRKGPGHYPETVLPGQRGNAAVAGHRTTYGAPFHRLDELEEGDVVHVTTPEGRFRYAVTWKRVVTPDDVSVLDPTSRPVLTLTTCHPLYSARERLVVRGRLLGEPVGDERTGDGRPRPGDATGAGTGNAVVAGSIGASEGLGTAGMAALALPALVGAAWWWAWRRRRRWTTWALGCALFLPSLLPAFVQVEYLMPAGV